MINMDSYLCKAKKITTGEWIEGYPYWISEHVNPNIMIKNSCVESHEVDSSSLCKFTGKEYMEHIRHIVLQINVLWIALVFMQKQQDILRCQLVI